VCCPLQQKRDWRYRKMKKIIFLVLAFLIFTPHSALAQTVDAEELMRQSFYRDDGADASFKIEMVLVDKTGDTRERELLIQTKDYGELIKTYIEFTAPADIKGTKFLSMENSEGDDTQYLYLAELGRARRIVSSQKKLRFVNTDFSYEDVQRRKPDKDNHRLLKESQYSGLSCAVIESVPKESSNSQYGKRISWIDKKSLVAVKIEFYNQRKELSKVFKVNKLGKKSGIWTTLESRMEDLKENHETLMKIKEVSYNQGLSDEIFSLRKLEEN
jgi:hypothetical protein